MCLLLIAGCWTKMVGSWLRRRRGRRHSRTTMSNSRWHIRTTTMLSRTPQVLVP
jgi:hypothetical protein